MTSNKDLDNEDLHVGRDAKNRLYRRRIDWDVRGILAIFAVIGAFALQAVMIVRGDAGDMPPWVVGLVSAIIAFYFGSRSSGSGA